MEQNTTNKPLRRVGTLTLGVCLIAAGVLFLLARFLPGLPWLVIWQVLPAAGLILLGCEVLYYSARPGACRCDFGSVVLCLLLSVMPVTAMAAETGAEPSAQAAGTAADFWRRCR